VPVDDATYRGWPGTAKATRWVAVAIAGTMVRRLMKLRLVRYIALVFPLGACLIAALVLNLAHEGEQSLPMLRRLPIQTSDILPFLNLWFQNAIGFFAILLAAMVGAPLIAEDRRTRALALYFSRPITHFDYVLGKFLTVAFFLTFLVVLPPVVMFLLDVGLADEKGIFLDRAPILLRSVVPSLVRVALLSVVALAASSLAKRTNYAALLLLGLMMVATIASQLFARRIFHDPVWLAISPGQCAMRIAHDLLPLPPLINQRGRFLQSMDVGYAWLGVGIWTATGLAVLLGRIRKVEVVA